MIKKSYERRVYESVDNSSLSLATYQKLTKKLLMQQGVNGLSYLTATLYAGIFMYENFHIMILIYSDIKNPLYFLDN